MKSPIQLIAFFLGAVLACFAGEKEPTTDADLVGLLSDSSSLSPSDSIAMESHVRAIRIWLLVSKGIPSEKTFGEAQSIVENRTADDVARIAALMVRLNSNRELVAALELDSLATQRMLNTSLTGKLHELDLKELAVSDADVRHCLKNRSIDNLPKLKFREKKQ